MACGGSHSIKYDGSEALLLLRAYPLVRPVVNGCIVNGIKAMLGCEVVPCQGGPWTDTVFWVILCIRIIETPEAFFANRNQVIAV